jgi:hypothetical protein
VLCIIDEPTRPVLQPLNSSSQQLRRIGKKIRVNGKGFGPNVMCELMGKFINNQIELNEKMDRIGNVNQTQEIDLNINLGLPATSINAFLELEAKMKEPANMNQLVSLTNYRRILI